MPGRLRGARPWLLHPCRAVPSGGHRAGTILLGADQRVQVGILDSVFTPRIHSSPRERHGPQAVMSSTVGAHSARMPPKVSLVYSSTRVRNEIGRPSTYTSAPGASALAASQVRTERVCAVSSQARVSSITATQRSRVAVR